MELFVWFWAILCVFLGAVNFMDFNHQHHWFNLIMGLFSVGVGLNLIRVIIYGGR